MKTCITLFSLILTLPFIAGAQFNPRDSRSPYEMQAVQVSTPENVNLFTLQKPLSGDENRFEFDSLNVSYQGSWALGPGFSISCNGPGNIVFVGAGAGVIVLDVSTPSSPVELGEIHTRGLVDAIYFDEVTSRMYLCTYFSGFEIWDVSNFSAPVRLGRGSTDGLPRGGIFASGNYVYVVTVANGVQVFDVSDPSSPVNTGNCPLSATDFAWNSAKSGNYIFVAIGNGGMKVVDVSNPVNPQVVGSSNLLTTGVWVANGYAYIVGYNFGMRVLNISNLSNITQVGYISLTGYPYRITVIGNYAYISNATTNTGGGINVVDVSTPASPQLISTYTGYAEYVTGNGQMVAFTSGVSYSILDISDPFNPVLASTYPLPGTAWDVAVSGNYAYSASNGFRVFDISDKTHPVQVGYDSNDGALIELAGDKAVYIRQSMGINNPVMIMDISNPAAPSKVGECMVPCMTWDLAIKVHYAFIACWWDGVRVIDFQDPANPVSVAHTFGWFNASSVPGEDYCYVQALDVEGNYLYLIDYYSTGTEDTRGLYIFDISDPTNPVKISRYTGLLSDGYDIDVVGDFAYISDMNGGMEVIDVTNKQFPQARGYISLPDVPRSIKVQANHAFIADYINGGVQVVNVTDPDNLNIDGYYTRSGCFALGVRVKGNNIYLADGLAGFQIYQTDDLIGVGGILAGTAVKSGSNQQAGVKVEAIGLNHYFTYTNDTSYYSIPYIPAGTYTIKYSAVGYVPQEIPGVQITEGQTTTEDVTMISTGEPPTNLIATQGAGTTVNLIWQAPSSGNITGYKIYRKVSELDFYPETPLDTIPASQLTFTDNTALLLKHYFYAVTATLSGNLQTPYSNDAEGWIYTGFIANELSAYVGSTPVIDGTINADEWSDAYKVDISDFLGTKDNTPNPVGSVMAYFKVNPEKTKLYCAVNDLNDVVLEDHDEVALYVDDNNDGTFPPTGDDSEGNFWAAHYASGDVIQYRPIYSNGEAGTVVNLPNPEISVSNASGHVVYEFVIPLGSDENWKINFNEQNQSGLFAFVLDDPSDFDGYWPCTNINTSNPAGYGVITFGDVDQTPPPPDGLVLSNQPPSLDIVLSWNQPEINDFEYFNIYWSTDGGATFPKLDSTVGVQYFLTVSSNGLYEFYVTTVDRAGHESVPSNIVQIDVFIGITEPNQGNEITMIKMGPNPFIWQLNIDFKVLYETHLNIRIFDITGKLLNTLYDSKIAAGLHHIAWNGKDNAGNDLQPGIYVVQFYTTNGSSTSFKIVRSR